MFKFTVVAFCVLMGLVRAEHDSIEVDGTLNCEGECYSSGALVELFDDDTWTRNDKMGETNTDSLGFFRVQGHASDFLTTIDPFIKIRHNCRGRDRCHKIEIPKRYVTKDTRIPQQTFHVGTYDLASASNNC